MSKIVARRNKDGRIEMLPRPVGSDDINPGDIRYYRRTYQEFHRPSMLNGYWRDVTAEVAAVLRQTFAAESPPAPQETTQ